MNFQKEFYSLGTENYIYAEGSNAEQAIDAVIKRVAEIDDKMSAFKPESEISKIALNAGVSETSVSNDVFLCNQKSVGFFKSQWRSI